ncbi:MAG TPA: flagellar biosynthetic protein FliR [Burkholderiales bacterium]|nr:flagellar biosynthetic protein FliR [Burkholderiales bacterium]
MEFTSLQLETWLAQGLWPFCRLLALFAVAPIYQERTIPAPVKVGLAMAITILVAPTLPGPAVGLSAPTAPAVLMQQILIGLAMGFSMRLAFAAVELAGDLIGLQMGLSFASFVDPQNNTQSPILGSLLNIFASLVFLAMNGHLLMIEAITNSFSLFPIGSSGFSANALPVNGMQLMAWGGEIFQTGLHLALPLLATMLVLNIAVGVLARASPQLSLFSVGFPLTLITGLLAIILTLPRIAPYLQTVLEQAARF